MSLSAAALGDDGDPHRNGHLESPQPSGVFGSAEFRNFEHFDTVNHSHGTGSGPLLSWRSTRDSRQDRSLQWLCRCHLGILAPFLRSLYARQESQLKSHEVLRRVVEGIGTKQVASDLRISTSLVYKWCTAPGEDDDMSGARNPLDRLVHLCESTEDRRPIEWLCQHFGGFFVENSGTEPREVDAEYLHHTQSMLHDFSTLLQTMSDSIAHEGRIDSDEARQIRRHWQKLQAQSECFVRACEEGRFDPER